MSTDPTPLPTPVERLDRAAGKAFKTYKRALAAELNAKAEVELKDSDANSRALEYAKVERREARADWIAAERSYRSAQG